MSEDLLVYGMKGSPFVRKVQVVQAHKEISYDFQGYADRIVARPSFANRVAEESRFFPAGDYQL